MNNGLFLPVEVLKREYVGKLCLAVEMAARGMPVFFGHKRRVIDLALQAREPGLLFYKDAGQDFDFGEKLKERGFGLIAQDEEAGIIFGDYAEFYKTRSSLNNIPNLDRFLCWGQDDYEFLKKQFDRDMSCRIVNTGSVRTVVWGDYGRRYFAEEIERIRSKYGRFVIFVTNFKTANSFLPKEQFLEMRARGRIIVSSYEAALERDKRLMELVIRAAKRIVAESDLNVVVRPHPEEAPDTWRKQFANYRKVGVEPDGDLIPWALASECVLQNSCTSGIQAVASGIPMYAFGQEEDDFKDIRSIPNELSERLTGEDEVVSKLCRAEPFAMPGEESAILLERKIKGAGTLGPLNATADEILDVCGTPNNNGNADLGKDSWIYDAKEIYRTSRFKKRSLGTILDQGKRQTIKKRSIRRDVNRFLEVLGHDVHIEVERVGPNVYCLRRG